jgi:hypothetical protein
MDLPLAQSRIINLSLPNQHTLIPLIFFPLNSIQQQVFIKLNSFGPTLSCHHNNLSMIIFGLYDESVQG